MYNRYYLGVYEGQIKLFKEGLTDEPECKHAFDIRDMEGKSISITGKTYSMLDSVLSTLASSNGDVSDEDIEC